MTTTAIRVVVLLDEWRGKLFTAIDIFVIISFGAWWHNLPLKNDITFFSSLIDCLSFSYKNYYLHDRYRLLFVHGAVGLPRWFLMILLHFLLIGHWLRRATKHTCCFPFLNPDRYCTAGWLGFLLSFGQPSPGIIALFQVFVCTRFPEVVSDCSRCLDV